LIQNYYSVLQTTDCMLTLYQLLIHKIYSYLQKSMIKKGITAETFVICIFLSCIFGNHSFTLISLIIYFRRYHNNIKSYSMAQGRVHHTNSLSWSDLSHTFNGIQKKKKNLKKQNDCSPSWQIGAIVCGSVWAAYSHADLLRAA